MAQGAAPGASLITDCQFLSLGLCIEIYGAIPTIRRCLFENVSGNGLVLRSAASPAPAEADPYTAALVDFCHVLLNSNEFLYID